MGRSGYAGIKVVDNDCRVLNAGCPLDASSNPSHASSGIRHSAFSNLGDPLVSVHRLLAILSIVPVLASAQILSHSMMGSADDVRTTPRVMSATSDSIRILAVRVQFQTDADKKTSGTGTFVTSTATTAALDAAPHDAAYFRCHLEFLANYFKRVSGGRTLLSATLLDSVVTLGQQMTAYTPTTTGSNVTLANLARDTWAAVDSLGLVSDFSRYDCFVVFHAGVGHDVDMVSELGYDPTPSDIPSIYLGLNALRAVYGSSYAGIPVKSGTQHVTNSVILPETESRTIPGTVSDYDLTLGLNGFLCASLGSYLGLPDLFNTSTGASGIGRFGLMDGQAIFSFSGAFPPAPSAWEKYWLGWLTPIEVPTGTTTLTLPATTIADSVYRVSISSSEYFLLENRNRNPYKNGVTLTTVVDGTTYQHTYAIDTTGFEALDISGLSGCVTDVSVPDWSLPGGTDENGVLYDGGVLVWHIDESAIAKGLADNTVNNTAGHKGVNVVEADGSQDIGQSYEDLTAGSGSEDGTLYDYWYKGNAATVYANSFSPTSIPNSNTNSGANSHVTINAFSARGPRMTATVKRGDSTAQPLAGFPKRVGQVLTSHSLTVAAMASSTPAILVAATPTSASSEQLNVTSGTSRGKLLAWNVNGTASLSGGMSDGTVVSAASGDSLGSAIVVPGTNGTSGLELVTPVLSSLPSHRGLRVEMMRDTTPADSFADSVLFLPTGGRLPVCPAVASDSLLVAGVSGGWLYFFSRDGARADSLHVFTDSSTSFAGVAKLPGTTGVVASTSNGMLFVVSVSIGTTGITATLGGSYEGHFVEPRKIVGPVVTLAGTTTREPSILFCTSDGYVFRLTTSLGSVDGFPLQAGSTITAAPALADVDGDGQPDIIVFSGGKISAYNLGGILLDNFPATVSSTSSITSDPIVADVNGDGLAEIVAVTEDGIVAAINKGGKNISGFPLAAGTGAQSAAVFTFSDSSGSRTALAVASSDDGGVHGWQTADAAATVLPWPQYQLDACHTGYCATASSAGTALSSEFFPKDRAYNWPNPVYNGVTHIRYYLGESASVHVKIFDLTGDLVTQLEGPGSAGIDNEVAWNVGGVQSGVYLARIEAVGSGKSDVKIIKIAVVK